MYSVTFEKITEVRMGSPYNAAEVELKGGFIPDLSGNTFQDKYVLSDDGHECILVQWKTIDNEPGFILWRLNELRKDVKKSERIEGCCDDLKIVDGKVLASVWIYESKRKKGKKIEVECF